MSAAKTRTAPKSRILLVDDHRSVLRGYQLMLDAEPDLVVCATAATARRATAASRAACVEMEFWPDCDHTFFATPHRSRLLDRIERWLLSISPAERPAEKSAERPAGKPA